MMRPPLYSTTLQSTSTSSITTTSSSVYETTTSRSSDFERAFPSHNHADWFQAKSSPHVHNYEFLFGSHIWTPPMQTQTYTSKVTKTVNTENTEKKEVSHHSINLMSPISVSLTSSSSGGSHFASPITSVPRAIIKSSPFGANQSDPEPRREAVQSDQQDLVKPSVNRKSLRSSNSRSYNDEGSSSASSCSSFSLSPSRKSCSSSSSSSTPTKKLPLRSINLDKNVIESIKESTKSGVVKLCNFCKVIFFPNFF